ncbi:MAG TPA: hypothetical protein VM165_16540 [Planctomycetaceae bacterium]|nr:hypothetical protein [Planctomycetaceae bacterium]
MTALPRALCGLVIGMLAVAATAQEVDPVLIDDVTPAVTEPVPPEKLAENPEKRLRAMAGLAALAGIAIVGVALLALIIIWGRRLRRINRQDLPEAPLKDELWFLKPPKTPPAESSPAPPNKPNH